LIEDRHCGMWNRTLAAGIKPYQFFVSHLVVGALLMIIQSAVFIFYTFIAWNVNFSTRNIFLISSLILLVGLTGIIYGLCISTVTDSSLVASFLSIIIAYPYICLSGEWKINLFKTLSSMIKYSNSNFRNSLAS
jgi:uncharacterized membrane protein